jgi:hypothetical protein
MVICGIKRAALFVVTAKPSTLIFTGKQDLHVIRMGEGEVQLAACTIENQTNGYGLDIAYLTYRLIDVIDTC